AEGRYAALLASCETGQVAGSDTERGVAAVLGALEHRSDLLLGAFRPPALADYREIGSERRLATYLKAWARVCPRPVVLFLDEIDALQDETLISVLRQLRDGYQDRPLAFPQSVALIGLRDVRDYKVRLRPDRDSLGTASPFNVKVRSLTIADFTATEVAELLGQHTAQTGQRFTEEAMAQVFELTRGQPWLVNALAAELVDEQVPDRTVSILPEHVEAAREVLIERRDTHLDSLVERLREERVRRIVEPILVGELLPRDVYSDDVAYCQDLGLGRLRGRHPQRLPIGNRRHRRVRGHRGPREPALRGSRRFPRLRVHVSGARGAQRQEVGAEQQRCRHDPAGARGAGSSWNGGVHGHRNDAGRGCGGPGELSARRRAVSGAVGDQQRQCLGLDATEFLSGLRSRRSGAWRSVRGSE
ncbi:MAG: hypothetical protein HYV63_32625, partial [Candidatus Schekmanbacteria bacterium]|nr:hypothetical protein [Candidatus Schekmanbacteria bacterium]